MKQIILTLDEDQIASLQQDFMRKQAGYKARIKVLTEQSEPNEHTTDELIRYQTRLIIYHYLNERFKSAMNTYAIARTRTRTVH
jgi:hypothetical protein